MGSGTRPVQTKLLIILDSEGFFAKERCHSEITTQRYGPPLYSSSPLWSHKLNTREMRNPLAKPQMCNFLRHLYFSAWDLHLLMRVSSVY